MMNWFRLTGSETPTRTTIHRMTLVSSQKVRLLFESSQQMPHIAEIVCMTNPVKGMVNASGECLGNVRADSVQNCVWSAGDRRRKVRRIAVSLEVSLHIRVDHGCRNNVAVS